MDNIPAGPPAAPPMEALQAIHGQNKAQFKALDKASAMSKILEQELGKLLKMGDAVSQDDVLEGMAKLVSKGADPKALTALMAGGPNGAPPMPDGGAPLAAWLEQQSQTLQQHQAQLQPMTALAGHKMAVSAMHLIGAQDVMSRTPKAPLAQAPSKTPLL